MNRWLQLSSLFCVSLVAGCTLQSDLQAVRADLAALERDSIRRNQEVSARLDALDQRLSSPDNNTRRELAETGATMDELRVEVQSLSGQVQEMQYRLQNNVGGSPEMGDRLATKLAELETRLATIEQRVDPQGRTALQPPPEKPSPPPLVVPSPSAGGQASLSRPPTQPPISGPTAQPSQHSASSADAERLYERALQEYNAKNNEVAIVLFKQFIRQYPEHELAGHAQYWLGEALYAQEQYEAAIVAFDEVVQKYADNSKVPAAILKQGYAFAALNDNGNARFLQQVQQKYPDSPEAKQAADRLKTLN